MASQQPAGQSRPRMPSGFPGSTTYNSALPHQTSNPLYSSSYSTSLTHQGSTDSQVFSAPCSVSANKCHRLWMMSLPICSVCYRWINITYYHVTLLILCISTYYVGISSVNLVIGIIIQLLLVPRLFCTPHILFAITQ